VSSRSTRVAKWDGARRRLATARSCLAASFVAALALHPAASVQAQAPEAASGPPASEFLNFLGETAGVNPEIAGYMDTREARRALRDAAGDHRPSITDAEPVPWDSLDPAAQEVLAAEKHRWDAVSRARQRNLADGARAYLAMSETDRAAAGARFNTWLESPPEVREQERKRWTRYRQLTPAQQDALREAYRQYLELPPPRRDAMRDRWQDMSAEELRRAIHRRQGPKPGTLDKRPCPPC
jgi:hypothetical protein